MIKYNIYLTLIVFEFIINNVNLDDVKLKIYIDIC